MHDHASDLTAAATRKNGPMGGIDSLSGLNKISKDFNERNGPSFFKREGFQFAFRKPE